MELARFLVELRGDAGRDGTPEPVETARRRANELAASGESVRVLRSVYAPEDDLWFLVVEAPSEQHVQRLLGGTSPAVRAISTRSRARRRPPVRPSRARPPAEAM